MEFDRIALKRLARRDMRGKHPSVLLVSFVYLLLTAFLGSAVSMVTFGPALWAPSLAQISELTGAELIELLRANGVDLAARLGLGSGLMLLVSVFAAVVQFGYTVYVLGLAQGRQMGMGSLIAGFGMLGRVLGLNIVIGFFTLLWTLAIFIPTGGLMGLSAWLFTRVVQMEWLAGLMANVLLVAAYVLLLARVLRYSMAQFALADDPEQGVMAALSRSKELMKGRRWELVKLELSFVGWYLAAYMMAMLLLYAAVIVLLLVTEIVYLNGALTEAEINRYMMLLVENIWVVLLVMELGMLLFSMWLTPYMSLTCSHFYCALSGKQVAQPLPEGVWVRRPDVGGVPSPRREPPPFPQPPAPPAPWEPPVSVTNEPPRADEGGERPADSWESPAPAPEEPLQADSGEEELLRAEDREEEPPVPAGPKELRSDDPWDRPADSRRNPDDPF